MEMAQSGGSVLAGSVVLKCMGPMVKRYLVRDLAKRSDRYTSEEIRRWRERGGECADLTNS